MNKLEQLYEGKAKKVFATEDPELVIVDYKDDATAFNGEKKGTIMGKGVINNRVTNFLMQKLEKEGVPTHFVEELSEREAVVKKVSIVPLEVIIRNIAAGSFSKTKAGGNQRLLIEGFQQEASYPFRRTVGGEKILLDSRCQPHRRQGGGTGNDAVQHGSEAAGRGPYIKAAQRRNVQSADLG